MWNTGCFKNGWSNFEEIITRTWKNCRLFSDDNNTYDLRNAGNSKKSDLLPLRFI